MLASMRNPVFSGVRAAVSARQLSSVARSSVRTVPAFRHSFYSTESSAQGTSSGSQSAPPPPPPPSAKGSSSTGLWIAIAAAVAGGGYYFYSFQGATSLVKKPLDYQTVYKAIADCLEEDAENYDDGSFAPVILRLAWHASGTYDKHTNTGGSNGATMRFAPESNHGANAGLLVARQKLEPIKAKFPEISYGDLWTLAGVVAVQEMGGPKIAWRPGRQDFTAENCPPDGRLPDGDKGADHVRKIFYKMGFNDQEIVALIGAHALGRCHKDRSGFDGPWTFSPTTFTNDFYKLLFDEKWTMRKWNGPPQYEDKKTKSLMMLVPDMSMVLDKGFKTYARKYADDESAFFADFSKAFAKLLELGVPEANFGETKPMTLKTVDELNEKKE